MTVLVDGTGTLYRVKVTEENALLVAGVTVTPEHHTNHVHAQAYNFLIDVTPEANSFFAYMKNTSETSIVVEGLTFRLTGTDANERFWFYANPEGTPVGDTSVPPNLNLGTKNAADGVFITANNITGLSGGTLIERLCTSSGTETIDFNFNQDIIMPRGSSLAIKAVNGGTEFIASVNFNYHDYF